MGNSLLMVRPPSSHQKLHLNVEIRFRVNIARLKKREGRGRVHSPLLVLGCHQGSLVPSDMERPPNCPLSCLIPREHADQTRTGFGSESLLLRGCTVRNTEVAAGIVIYAGDSSFCPLPLSFLLCPLLQTHLQVRGNAHQFPGGGVT